MHTLVETVETPVGDARTTRFPADGVRSAVLMLGHGIGGGIDAPDLQALAAALPALGVEVVLVEQPWRVAGKRLGPPPKTLDVAWRAIVDHVGASLVGDVAHHKVPLLVGGRSAGARVACRTGRDTGASAVLALAFPLHPPGKPEKSRADELTGTGLPTLVVQGAVDPFGNPSEFPALPPTTHRLVGLAAGGHEFAVRKSQEPVIGAVTDAVATWIKTLIR